MKQYLIIGALLALTSCADLTPTPTPQVSDGTITVHTEPEGAAILLGRSTSPDSVFQPIDDWQLIGYSPVNVPVKVSSEGYVYGGYWYCRAVPTGPGQYIQQWQLQRQGSVTISCTTHNHE